MSEEKQAYNIATAQAAIDADKKHRAELCFTEISKLLAAYRCDIVAQPQITPDGRIVAPVTIIAKL